MAASEPHYERAEHPVSIPVGEVTVEGNLVLPDRIDGLVLFAHGSGSSRHSPRNRYVAQVLQEGGMGTLLMDLLTREEEQEDMFTAHLRFDIELLAGRLIAATDWLATRDDTRDLRLGYFGASTGAAAALYAAAARPERVAAIVSRGGRPDMAAPVLSKVKAPTLLIVGGKDYPVISMNQEALEGLDAEKELRIVEGATHLFEEPGTLEQVSRLATDWFLTYLS
ncbi:MAG: dienelactone hydrolase family protein [Pseudomonadota bacterium]